MQKLIITKCNLWKTFNLCFEKCKKVYKTGKFALTNRVKELKMTYQKQKKR